MTETTTMPAAEKSQSRNPVDLLLRRRQAEGSAAMRDLLGGKGAGLAEMTNAGVPVPPGFTITTEVCRFYYANGRHAAARLRGAADARRSTRLERVMGKKLGDADDPLLVSVRSGAKFSMPGMMDTILNLGLNDRTVAGARAQDRQPALRLGLLPPLHPDVRRRRARISRSTSSSTLSTALKKQAQGASSTPTSPPRT